MADRWPLVVSRPIRRLGLALFGIGAVWDWRCLGFGAVSSLRGSDIVVFYNYPTHRIPTMLTPARRRSSARRPRASADDVEADASDVYDVMTELLRIYQFRDRDRVASHGLTVTQAYALDIILRRGEMAAKELAEELALEKSTVSRLIDGMVTNELIERSGHPRDARSALLRVAPLGRRLYSAFRRNIVRENVDVLRGLSPDQRATLIETLRRFTDAAKRRIRGAHP